MNDTHRNGAVPAGFYQYAVPSTVLRDSGHIAEVSSFVVYPNDRRVSVRAVSEPPVERLLSPWRYVDRPIERHLLARRWVFPYRYVERVFSTARIVHPYVRGPSPTVASTAFSTSRRTVYRPTHDTCSCCFQDRSTIESGHVPTHAGRDRTAPVKFNPCSIASFRATPNRHWTRQAEERGSGIGDGNRRLGTGTTDRGREPPVGEGPRRAAKRYFSEPIKPGTKP